ncbi:hypothetical protein Tco_0889049 [Tanacetum coccineum]
MSSITAQQTKLDLELVLKKKRVDIGKCNKRLNPGKIQRESTFQCYSAFLITADIPEFYMHQFWDSGQDFDALPTNEEIVSFLRDLGHTGEIHSLNVLLFIRCINPKELLLLLLTEVYLERQLVLTSFVSPEHKSFRRNKIRMHTFKDDYLINTLRFVSAKEETQIYGAILLNSLTSPEMKETKAYKTYLVLTEELTGKSKRVKRPAKKSTKASARGVVIRETPEMPLSKKKEKVVVTRGKGIELLSQVALTEDTQFEEVRKKSIRDFHKTHLSGSGIVTKNALSVAKIKPSVTSEGTGGNDEDDSNNEQDSSDEDSEQENDNDDNKTQSDDENESDSDHETEENKSGSKSNHKENEEDEDDEEEVKDKFVKTPSNDFDDENEIKIDVKTKGDEDEKMDYTTSQLYDDG